MKLTFECPNCKRKHTLTDKEFNKLIKTDKCSYICKCGSHIKIIQDDEGFEFEY